MNKHFLIAAGAFLGLTAGLSAQATPPNAGNVLRDNQNSAPKPPVAAKVKQVAPVDDLSQAPVLGGSDALVASVVLKGNTAFGSDELTGLISGQFGKRHTLESMRGLARTIGDHYRRNGYPFARAFIPAQSFKDGGLEIVILEGRYDRVLATGTREMIEGVTPFLAYLKTDDLIYGPELERRMLIIDDIPGVAVSPTVSPGTRLGTSELAVNTFFDSRHGGDAGVDNYGSRYTGYYRAHVSWGENSLLQFGDRASLMAMVTSENMLLGSLDYEAPVNGSGLRWQVGYSHTTYQLGREFAALDASGLAKVWSAKLSYPIIRSQATNLLASVGFQHKDLFDDYKVAGTTESKWADLIPLNLRFDHRDQFLAGGVSFGLLSFTFGQLHLDPALTVTDAATARRAGSFGHVNLDLARIQSLGSGFSLYGRFSVQRSTNGNLDSSERIGIAGSEGVRAYPLGEGSGDDGWVAQLEARYDAGDFAPYAFYDAGSTDLNHRPWDVASTSTRTISGAGLGVRYNHDKWSANLAVAFRIDGGAPTADVGKGSARLLVSASRTF